MYSSDLRLYFSSQRVSGETFEVTGPFAPRPIPVLGGGFTALLAAALGVAGALLLRSRAADPDTARSPADAQ